ncbi:MAG: hypothetical protein ABSD51_06580, partial [Candidatus Binatus sp.]
DSSRQRRFTMSTLGSEMTDMLCHFSMALIVVLLSAGVAVSEDKPPPIYVDVGACPFECCTYRMWTVNEATTLWSEPDGNAVVGILREGKVVQGLTGEVISKPLAVKADRDIPETPIRTGDTFYVLHYEGEGNWKVWLHGETTDVFYQFMHMPHPPKEDWWVKVKDAEGNVGWTLSDRHFLHQDACE